MNHKKEEKKEEKNNMIEKKNISWGNQIRSYVLHPYKQVKDSRSGYESSDVEGVLDGNLQPLIDAYLNSNLGIKNKH